jgi:hypothetical protein
VAWIGLAHDPLAQPSSAIAGMLQDSRTEMQGGVSSSYEIHGTAISNGDDSLDITLASRQEPHMFDPGSPLQHFTVAVARVTRTADCVYK